MHSACEPVGKVSRQVTVEPLFQASLASSTERDWDYVLYLPGDLKNHCPDDSVGLNTQI